MSSKTTETVPKCEREVMTQTGNAGAGGERTCTTQTSLNESADLTKEEIQTQLLELEQELESRCVPPS